MDKLVRTSLCYNSLVLMAGCVLCLVRHVQCQVDYSVPFQTPVDCLSGSGDEYHEYYDTTQLICTPCSQNSTIQTVSENGLSCICQKEYRISGSLSNPKDLRCRKCPAGQIASEDGWSCVTCTTVVAPPGDDCPDCSEPDTLTAERDLVGKWLLDSQNDTTVTCVTCVNGTLPDSQDHRCERCNQVLSVQTTGCDCPPDRQAGGLCFASSDDLQEEVFLDYTVVYETDVELISIYMKDNLRAAQASCTNFTRLDPGVRVDYSNLTACQHLGNLCVMTLYSSRYDPETPNPANDACSLYKRLVQSYPDNNFPAHETGYRSQTNNLQAWKANMPWLYYLHDVDDSVEDILDDTSIDFEYTKESYIDLQVVSYSLTGQYEGISGLEDRMLLLCGGGTAAVDAALKFATKYSKKCSVPVDTLFNSTESLEFHELYLRYTSSETRETRLHAVPIRLINYLDQDGAAVNEGSDRTKWQLVRRYFMLDQLTGVQEGGTVSPAVVRYLSKVELVITQQTDSQTGLIYPPYVSLTYDYVTADSYGTEAEVEVSFSVRYTTNQDSTDRNIMIALIVMAALALVVAALQTSNWNKREGKITVDCTTIMRFFMFLAGSLANAFFVTIWGFSLWLFIIYKAQNVMYVIPDDGLDYYIKAFIGSAFALKFLHVVQLLASQCRTDIFFLDWEKPKRTRNEELSDLPTRSQVEAYTKKQGPPVSIWRSFFIANEWNEIQCIRKVNLMFQLVFMLIILHVAGVENLARVETESRVSYAADEYKPPYSTVFRFALSASIYIGLALLQWLFQTVFWTRCVSDPIMNFVDLCSMCNVSIFVFAYEQYGYYIHGRTVHGMGDVGIRDMFENLTREEENLVSERGLLPGEGDQIFEVFIPKKLRNEYNKVLFKVFQQTRSVGGGASGDGGRGERLNQDTEKRLDAYTVINRFLQNYIDHNLKAVDYVVSQKNLLERIMDTEFVKDFEHGYFFIDSGKRFTSTMFYGSETVLVMFEVLLFSVMDFASDSFIVAAIVTYAVWEIVWRIRYGAGRNNLASKTMIDKRFLI